ncbi:MAG: hypothetical protein Q7U51_07450, partial [Methanoregula sp.]|nr:hypothetical protein [Methanoregula sp.]
MKIAFITHAIGVGGGSLSSSKTIQYLIEKKLLIPDQCIIIHQGRQQPSTEKNDVYFNLKKSIMCYQCKLPFSLAYKGSPSYKHAIYYEIYRYILLTYITLYFFISFNKILKKERISVVHLNSLVLWPLLLVLPKQMKKIVHIREPPNELIEGKIAVFIMKRYATKIISIDYITNSMFKDSDKSVVIMNPFDMRMARSLRQKKNILKKQFTINPETFIISIIGRIED